ncbi:MAG: hypothetical protein BalsKO_20540 [Balneolaceae bacterium]
MIEKAILTEKIDSSKTTDIKDKALELPLDSLQRYYGGNYLYGYKNGNDETIINAEYHGLGEPSNQRILAYKRLKKEDYIGYLDLDGDVVIPLVYNAGGNFKNNSALVRDKNGNEVLIDTSGNIKAKLTQAFIDSLVDKPFSTSNFQELKSCLSQLRYKMIYTLLLNCSDFLFSEQIWVKNYETCPSPIGSECSTSTTYGLYKDGYFNTKGLYEDFKNDIYLYSIDEKAAKVWLLSFMQVFGFEFLEEKSSPNRTDIVIDYINSESEQKASATIICGSTYCKISPYILNNF